MEVELLKKYGSVSPGKIENLDGTTETVDFRFRSEEHTSEPQSRE